MKIMSVVGARPQFIKAAPVSWALRAAGHRDYLVHTGQHYDYEMSEIFFQELDLPAPDVNLGVGSGSHGAQTGAILQSIEREMVAQAPDVVVVYGDTNSTLAAALAACKLGIPLAHIEAGLRSYNRTMPEEHNRVLTDHCADLLFCPTEAAIANLAREGISRGVYHVGDTMRDILVACTERIDGRSSVLSRYGVAEREYYLATIHRAANTDDPERLRAIFTALGRLERRVLLPLHPRTRASLDTGLLEPIGGVPGSVSIVEPVGYLDMIALQSRALGILTDSGGIQKEAFWLEVPCFTLRDETEWTETVDAGWNAVVGVDAERIVETVAGWRRPPEPPPPYYGTGDAGPRVVQRLVEALS